MKYLSIFLSSFLWVSQASAELDRTSKSSLKLEDSVWKISHSLVAEGTAFAVGPNQFITNFHVIYFLLKDVESSQEIVLSQEGQTLRFNQLLKIDSLYDLALFETKESVSNYLSVTDIPIETEEALFVIGYPQGKLRKVKNTKRVIYEDDLSYGFPVDYFYLFGSSGSPVFNKKGKPVGVIHEAVGNILHMIKIEHLEKFIKGQEVLVCSDFLDIELCFKEEIVNLKIQAEKGDIFSQYRLAGIYYRDEEIDGDLKQAFYWYERAANQGFIKAQNDIADMYYTGEGVDKDLEQAFSWYEKAANQNFTPAQYNIADMYHKAEGVDKDLEQAFSWYKRAANQNFAPAQYNVADMYYTGEGVDKDLEQAFSWYERAANQNFAPAQYNVADMYRKGEGVDRDFEQAFYWYERAANQNFAPAQTILAYIYLYRKGEGEDEDLEQAFDSYEKAFSQGYLLIQ